MEITQHHTITKYGKQLENVHILYLEAMLTDTGNSKKEIQIILATQLHH